MASLPDLFLSTASPLATGGIYFVFFSYPNEVTAKGAELDLRQQEMLAEIRDRDDAMTVIGQSYQVLEAFQSVVIDGATPDMARDLRKAVMRCQARLKGLEITEQPLHSHIEKLLAMASDAVEVTETWDGSALVDKMDKYGCDAE